MAKEISRRNFLKGMAASAAIAGVAGLAGCGNTGTGGAVTDAASDAASTAVTGGAGGTATYIPGTYTSTAQGLESAVTVTMTFDENSITDVVIDASGETESLGGKAAEELQKSILSGQTSEVDAMSGATVTSNAIKKAAADCIAQAKGEAASGGASEETTASSGDDWLGEEPEINDADVYKEEEADVVIVGLGLAGVAAARKASELGANVIGIECSAAPNCRSGEYAVINSPSLNKRWPERALTNEEVDEIIDSHVNESGYRVKRSITKKWADNIGETFDWWIEADEKLFIADETRQAIEDENADDFLVPIFRPLPSYKDESGKVHEYNWKEERFPCYPTSVEFLPNQGVTFNANWQKALDSNKVTGYFGHFAKKLIMENGKCVGVYALNDNPGDADQGKYIKVKASKGVIISTGDFGSNDAAMYHFAPEVMETHKNNRLFTSVDVNGKQTNQGDGLRLGAWAGAKVAGYVAPMIHHMGGGADLSGVGVMGNAGFLNLDMDGKRYMCEDLPGQQLENQVEQTRLMSSWQFFDANWPEQVTHMPAAHGGACYYEDYKSADEAPKNNATYRNWKAPYQLEAAIEDGRCLTADTIEELVAKVYPDDKNAQENAIASIKRYNELVEKGYDEDFHKVKSRLLPVDTAPFYADQFTTAICLTVIGGLESDEDCHTFAVQEDENGRQIAGEIIKGLYVAGNMQGNRFGMQYPIGLKGVSHAMAMYYGTVAAENAVKGI